MGESILFHVCCAPCATVGVPTLISEGYSMTLYYYGGNIHPEIEWRKRLEALYMLSRNYNTLLYARPYDTQEWNSVAEGLEDEPEGGTRCEACMKLQLESAALYAQLQHIKNLCTSLTLSPQKDPVLINQWGETVAARYGLNWFSRVWRKNGGFLFSVQESKRLSLYRQNYCGCRYSLKIRAAMEANEDDRPAKRN